MVSGTVVYKVTAILCLAVAAPILKAVAAVL